MKVIKENNISIGNLCVLHDDKWIHKQRIAGNIAGKALNILCNLVKEKTIKSLLELDSIVEEFIISNGCTPTFKNYHGFPAATCISVDNEKSHALVHGIPYDYKLQDGDIVSFDLGATYEGAIGDTATTCIFGNPKHEKHVRLIEDTKESLIRGIKSISIGKKIGSIGESIYKFLSPKYYGVVNNYGGHSLNYNEPHAFPFIANKSNRNEGVTIQQGMTLAIEPLVVLDNSTDTWIGNDKWTVFTKNTSSHEEHTIFVHEKYIEIMTYRDGLDYPKEIYFEEK